MHHQLFKDLARALPNTLAECKKDRLWGFTPDNMKSIRLIRKAHTLFITLDLPTYLKDHLGSDYEIITRESTTHIYIIIKKESFIFRSTPLPIHQSLESHFFQRIQNA